MGPALAVALCLQLGLTGVLIGVPLLAGALLATAAALLTIFAISAGAASAETQRKLPQSVFGVILTIVLASGLTVGGLSGRVIHHPRLANDKSPETPGLIDSLRAILREVFYGEQPAAIKDVTKPNTAKETPPAPDPESHGPGAFEDGSFPGVILLPEVRPVPVLVAPRPSRMMSGVPGQPYGIPFGGEYWFYRWMYHRPPSNSFRRKGSPAALSFSTTDRWPLEMEARQRLDQPIDLACCRKIQVQIWNADRYPGTVSLELSLIDSEAGNVISLGGTPVQSQPDLKKEPVTAVAEMLDFSVPPGMSGPFNELKVSFRRDRSRGDKSARIAIERFLLVP
jgi:hypothetical protein